MTARQRQIDRAMLTAACMLLAVPCAAQSTVTYRAYALHDPNYPQLDETCLDATLTGEAVCVVQGFGQNQSPPMWELVKHGSPPAMILPDGTPFTIGFISGISNDGSWLMGVYVGALNAYHGFTYNVLTKQAKTFDVPGAYQSFETGTMPSAIDRYSTSANPVFAGSFTRRAGCTQAFSSVDGAIRYPDLGGSCTAYVAAMNRVGALAGTLGSDTYGDAGTSLFEKPRAGPLAELGGAAGHYYSVQGLTKDGLVLGTTAKRIFTYDPVTQKVTTIPPNPAATNQQYAVGVTSPRGSVPTTILSVDIVQTPGQQELNSLYSRGRRSNISFKLAPVKAGDAIFGIKSTAIEDNGTIVGYFEECLGSDCSTVSTSGFIAFPEHPPG